MDAASQPLAELGKALRQLYPELAQIADVADVPAYVVGGAVRDALLGRDRGDLDLLVLGDAERLAAALSSHPVASHDRFGTATVELGGHRIDIAGARTETYPAPGALPVVAPAPDAESDLARRDFTVNAIAVPLTGGAPIDPHGGVADVAARLLRVLHERSFADDPTRAIRAARYAARLGFRLAPETEDLLRATDLATVSDDRRGAELARLAAEPSGPAGLALLAGWGLVELRPGGAELAVAVAELLGDEPWREEAPHAEAVLVAALGPARGEADLAAASPSRPSDGYELARGRDPVELVLARALGAEWLDTYLREWRSVALEIDGAALLAAGIPEGPALGRALGAARRATLDGEVRGREQQLAVALAAARARLEVDT
ncbi:MAG: CCA tRNA nucleotidyltransferase [Actinobacteria bacterium]|nr:CCA tRNA nucleotidyltransferase [Actinomycetota bacterium]